MFVSSVNTCKNVFSNFDISFLEYLRESEEKSEFSFAVAGAVNIMRKLTTVGKVIICPIHTKA